MQRLFPGAVRYIATTLASERTPAPKRNTYPGVLLGVQVSNLLLDKDAIAPS